MATNTQPALTGGEQTALAGPTSVKRYLSVATPTSVFSTTVTNDAFDPSNSILTNTTPGADIPAFSTIKITRSGVLVGYYRLRRIWIAGGTCLIGDTSIGDPGLITIPVRTLGIKANDTLTVLDRPDLWSSQPRIITGAIQEDAMLYANWVTEWGSDNQYPDFILNMGAHRSQFVDTGQTYATMTFTVNVIRWTSARTVGSYTWTIPGSWTVTSGSSATQTFTARVPAGTYTLRLKVTQDNGNYTKAFRIVWVHDSGSNAPIAITEVVSDERDMTGRRMVLGFNGGTLASLQDGLFVNYFEVPLWNGGDVASATRNFSGWIVRDRRKLEFVGHGAECEIAGPADVLKQLGGYSQRISRVTVAPTNFNEVDQFICGQEFFIWYMLRIRAPNLLAMFDHNPLSISGSTPPVVSQSYLRKSASVPALNLLAQAQYLAGLMKANYGHDSTGAGWVRLPYNLIDTITRSNAAVTPIRDTLSMGKYTLPLTYEHRLKPECRKVRLEGWYFDTAGVVTGVLRADAPGKAPGQGVNDINEDRVELAGSSAVPALANAKQLAGMIYADANNPYPSIPIDIPNNRDVYEPAQVPAITFQIVQGRTPDNITVSMNGQVTRVTRQHHNDGGAVDTHLDVIGETQGTDGVEVTVL